MILPERRWVNLKSTIMTSLVFCLALATGGRIFAQSAETSAQYPWDQSQVMMPEELAKLLAKSQGKRPRVVCVGFEFLYKGAHIPMAEFAGPGREAKGIEALQKWASGIPHSKEVVIYCGCCPVNVCPNLRPAFLALRQMGFQHLKVLYLENDLAKDWVGKGFATEKGSQK